MTSSTQAVSLAQLQAEFAQHLLCDDAAIKNRIVGDDADTAHPRLAIYHHAYFSRLAEALAQDYQTVHTLLGDDAFHALCRRYTDRYPSTYPSLRWFGQHLPQFLADNAPYRDHPYLAELANFEWMLVTAFDAPDRVAATVADAERVAPERWPELRITLHPSVAWRAHRWNILPVWQAAAGEAETMPEFQRLPQAQHCVVWRHALVTRFRTLETGEHRLLVGIDAGLNFSELCLHLAAADPAPDAVPLRAASILKTWLSQGMIVSLA